VWRDWALVGVPVPTAVLEGFLRPEMPYRIIAVVSVAGLLPTLLWRRTRPLLMIAIAFVTAGLLLPLTTGGDPPETYTSAAFLILIYALCRWGSGREVVIGMAIVLVDAAVSMALDRAPVGRCDRRLRGPVLGGRSGHGTAVPVQGADPGGRPDHAGRTGTAGPRPARHRRAPRVGDRDPRPGRHRGGPLSRTRRPTRCT
jgi:hypothetical protein